MDEDVWWDMLWERLDLASPQTRADWDLVDDVRHIVDGIVTARTETLEIKLKDMREEYEGKQ